MSSDPQLQGQQNDQLLRRIFTAAVFILGSSLLIIDSVEQRPQLQLGEIATRDIRAPNTFSYIDSTLFNQQKELVTSRVAPVFELDNRIHTNLQENLARAFKSARAQIDQLEETKRQQDLLDKEVDDAPSPEEEQTSSNERYAYVMTSFANTLGIHLSSQDLELFTKLSFSKDLEEETRRLLEQVMQEFITNDKLPKDSDKFRIIHIYGSSYDSTGTALAGLKDEATYRDWAKIITPEEARQKASNYANRPTENTQRQHAALSLTQAMIRANLSLNQLETEKRKSAAANALTPEELLIKQGTILLREGDPMSTEVLSKIEQGFPSTNQLGSWLSSLFAIIAVISTILISLYSFGAGYIKKFSTRTQDLEAMTVLTLLCLGSGRLIEASSLMMSSAVGYGMGPTALWYIAPFATGAMLVRVLINSETALVWVLGSSLLMGMMLEQQVLITVYFIISGLIAAASLAHIEERIQLMRAGLQTGLINAAVALLIELVLLNLNNANPVLAASEQPLWDVGMAMMGGIASAFLALGLLPIFEALGFVTDYKMLELGNPNHPLLRQLMTKAPGTYHHSMTMAYLSEAAAERIGANALQTRIACYYHDIGKSMHPNFFIENQRGNHNPHDRLTPTQSARIIKTHVTDGLALAEQFELPQPILNAITMHHGTSLIKYFYIKEIEKQTALGDAGVEVLESDFRYSGTPPSTREAGIIFLADRVEAACRTLKDPNAQDFRDMIQKLVNGAVSEGQLVDCPLTIKEIYSVIDVFSETMMSIYHHRIEYPKMPNLKEKASSSAGGVITLEIPNPILEESAQNVAAAPNKASVRDSSTSVQTSTQEEVDPSKTAPSS